MDLLRGSGLQGQSHISQSSEEEPVEYRQAHGHADVGDKTADRRRGPHPDWLEFRRPSVTERDG